MSADLPSMTGAPLEPCPWCQSAPLTHDDAANERYRIFCVCLFTGDDASIEVVGRFSVDAQQRWNQLATAVRNQARLASSVRAAESKDAEIARLRDVARAAEAVLVQFMPEHIDSVSSTTVGTTLRAALDAARSSGAIGGEETDE